MMRQRLFNAAITDQPASPSELNKQVAFLLVFNSFGPLNNTGGNAVYSANDAVRWNICFQYFQLYIQFTEYSILKLFSAGLQG